MCINTANTNYAKILTVTSFKCDTTHDLHCTHARVELSVRSTSVRISVRISICNSGYQCPMNQYLRGYPRLPTDGPDDSVRISVEKARISVRKQCSTDSSIHVTKTSAKNTAETPISYNKTRQRNDDHHKAHTP